MNKFSLVIIIACLAIGYLFYQNTQLTVKNRQLVQQNEFAKQKEQGSGTSIENKVRCQKDGQQFYDEKKKKESSEAYAYGITLGPNFIYSSKLNTCLIFWEDLQLEGNNPSIWVRHITDIYTNNDVASWWRTMLKDGKFEDRKGTEASFNQSLQQYGLY